MYQVEKDYRNNDSLRKSFNELVEKTFGFNFENWYQNGFWGDNYNPYSIVIDGKVDGIYLFGNDGVLDYYPKFGFQKSKEYQYSKKVSNQGENQLEQVIMDNPDAWKKLLDGMDRNVFHGKCDMVGNGNLIMFYITGFMQESVYYHKDTDTYIIADVEEKNVCIHNVFSSTITDLEVVIKLFGTAIKEVTLGFAPAETTGYEVIEWHEEDCTYFIKGEGMKVVEEEKLRIPSLAHA